MPRPNKFQCLASMVVAMLYLSLTMYGQEKRQLKGDINVEVAVVNVGPIIPGTLLRLDASVQFKDVDDFNRFNTSESPWWQDINLVLQQLSPDSLRETQWHEVREADKYWRITPSLENPLDISTSANLATKVLSKSFVAELHPAQVKPGTIYALYAVLDTRTTVSQHKERPSVFIPQLGASLFQVQSDSAIIENQAHINFLTDMYRGELHRGNFEAAISANKEAVALGLDAIVAEFNMIDILLYQEKYQEALEQYEKVLLMDSEARKKNSQLDPLVLPSTLDAFREKVQKKINEKKN